jgi:hypothetical protein
MIFARNGSQTELMMIRALFGFLVISSCGVLQASPLLYFTLEGRKQGSMDAFASSVEIALGDVIEYRLQMSMAPLGTENEYLGSYRSPPYWDGVNSLSISILQQPTDPIQVDLNSPAVLAGDSGPLARDGWQGKAEAKGGDSSPRGGSGFNDLLAIRPIHAPGVYTGRQEESVFSGVFAVTTVTGDSSQVQPKWGPVSGGGRVDGRVFFVSGPLNTNNRNTESSADPLTHFTALTLTAAGFQAVPEPSTIALMASALVGLVCIRRKFQR